MAKTLKLWNGRAYCCRKRSDPLWDDVRPNGYQKAYVAAYSRADARRVIQEYCGTLPSDGELRDYFSECWGRSMEGITPERGLWLEFGKGPVQVVAPRKTGGNDWRKPTTHLQRFGDAMELLCAGKRPDDALLKAWTAGTSEELQIFAAEHGPAWAQGIGLIDAALMAASQPTEGVEHEMPATSTE